MLNPNAKPHHRTYLSSRMRISYLFVAQFSDPYALHYYKTISGSVVPTSAGWHTLQCVLWRGAFDAAYIVSVAGSNMRVGPYLQAFSRPSNLRPSTRSFGLVGNVRFVITIAPRNVVHERQ